MKRSFAILFSLLILKAFPQQITPLGLITQMFDTIKTVKTLRYKIKATERINNSYLTAVSENKILTSPRKQYFLNPEKKLEILYVAGTNNNKAIVKPHVFPYITLSLNPLGNMMRKNQHYTILDLGFDFIAKVMVLTLSKEKEVAKSMSYLGIQNHNGIKCHLVVYENKKFGYFEYTVLNKETVSSISSKLLVNDYMVRTKNDLFNEFGYLKAGTKLLIPDLYCKKAIIFLEEKTLLPISVSIYDDVGIFESYEFSNIIVNKPFEENEFTKQYKDYHF